MAFELGVVSNIDIVARILDGTARQLPFAMARAINGTAKDVQRAQTGRIRQVFTIRRPSFATRAVKIKPFARKDRLEAKLQIEPPGGKARADIFAKFEKGGIKRPRGQHLAIPRGARRGKSGIVTKANRPRALGLQRKGRTVRGRKRTFIIPNVGIFQRVGRGRGRSKVRLLYSFHRQVPIDRRLRFVATAEKVVPRVFPGHFRREFAHAVRTARR